MSSSLGAVGRRQPVSTACFSIHAPAGPQVLPRVLEVFAKRGLVPTQWYSSVCGERNEELQIDIQVAGLADEIGERVAQCLRQLYCVQTVLTSSKDALAA